LSYSTQIELKLSKTKKIDTNRRCLSPIQCNHWSCKTNQNRKYFRLLNISFVNCYPTVVTIFYFYKLCCNWNLAVVLMICFISHYPQLSATWFSILIESCVIVV
jgi:hypothetical protein